MRVKPTTRSRHTAASEDGFTMLFALLALFVGSLLAAAALTAANGDISLSRKSTAQNKAYYAAVAGVDRYQYQLGANPNYWIQCPTLPSSGTTPISVPETSDESYTVKTLSSSGTTACTPNSPTNKQTSILETTGTANGTFRILSTGTSGTTTRKIVATFTHPGFLNYVYLSNYEILDPAAQSPSPTECEHYYEYRLEHNLVETCGTIVWASKDKVNGPMHTNDAAAMCASGTSKPTFGRVGESPPDKIEINGGHYAGCGTGSDSATFNGTYREDGPTLLPPETDNELLESAGYKFNGKTTIVLNSGTPNTMTITTSKGTETKVFPTNGVVYVENSATGSCSPYTPFGSNYTTDTACGNVYVHGSYTESLTIAAANDIIINGNLTTTNESGKPTGAAALGLIATNFVRVYHPVNTTYEVEHYTPKTATASGTNCSATSTLKTTGKLSTSSKEVTNFSTSAAEELRVGDGVSGTGIPASTKITAINIGRFGTTITLNNTPSKAGTSVELTFTMPYEYFSGIKLCVERPKVNYTFHETEKLDAEECNEFENHTEAYAGGGKCSYTITSKGCDASNATGSLENPIIDAAILSTAHSFINDNFECGDNLGELTIWGSIAQFWRGTVGRGEAGYIKNYNYDDRLSDIQPPSFLSPSTTSWHLSRETAPPTSFTG